MKTSAQRQAKYRELNREKINARNRELLYASPERLLHRKIVKAEWYVKNAEQCKEATSLWKKENREQVNSSVTAWREKNPEKVKEISRAYYIKNTSSCIANSKLYKAKKIQAVPSWANRFYMSEAYRLARLRTKITGIKWEVDHFYPLQSDLVCGLHVENNLQVIPAVMNRSKGNKVIHHG